MEFYTSFYEKRPVRLSKETRKFAYESLNYKYGLDTLKVMNVPLKHIEGFEKMTPLQKYDCAVYEVCKNAPLRICDGELLSGAATLGDAMIQYIPAAYSLGDDREWYYGVSHLTANFFDVVNYGMDYIRKKTENSLNSHTSPEKKEFLKSCLHAIDCMEIWHKRYIDELEKRDGYENNIKNLKNVPFKGAKSFCEAVQSLWFTFAFLRLLGCWPGIGRIDVLLGKYLKSDLENGAITLDEAREILAHFFIKGCEWICGKECGSGDAQHYQNLVISGIDENGNDVTNEVTYLVLDIIEETGISDFPTTVRINKNTDEKLLNRVSEVIKYGGGTLAVYNEDLILESLQNMGYPLNEARKFANDGCWEVQIPGKTCFSYCPFDSLGILQHETLKDYEKTDFLSFDELLTQYKQDLKKVILSLFNQRLMSKFEEGSLNFKKSHPASVISLFVDGCIEKGASYYEGGAVYEVISPHIGGLADLVNSLYAIKKAVFEEKLITFEEFAKILKNNWEGQEKLRRHIANDYLYYGNDNDEVDLLAADILNDFSDMCMEYDGKTPVRFISGVSTFGRQVDWAPSRIATPFGRKKGEVLAGNMSPTPGTDFNGNAAIIKSYCKADLKKQYTGAALDLGFIPSNLESDNAETALSGLIKAFVRLGGYFMNIDTIDKQTLINAQKNPSNYKNLSVRVSGWNARFITLNREWQNMIIDRSGKK